MDDFGAPMDVSTKHLNILWNSIPK